MAAHLERFTESIGLKVTKEQLQHLQTLADQEQKPLAEWCRDMLIKAAMPPPARPSEFAVIAEVTATQAILIDMLCALGRDGRITTQKAQEIVDRAHNAKFREAVELLRYAYSRVTKLGLDGQASHECAPRNTERVG